MSMPVLAGVEVKVVVAALTAYLLPAVDAFLGLLVASGVPLGPELREAIVRFVAAQLPIIVFLAAYAAPHTRRPDLENPAIRERP